jgi:hypothetical protein
MHTSTLTKEEIEMLVEQKVMELLGDPDSGLPLKEAFKKRLRKRIKNLLHTTPHREIVKKYASS